MANYFKKDMYDAIQICINGISRERKSMTEALNRIRPYLNEDGVRAARDAIDAYNDLIASMEKVKRNLQL